MTDATPPPDPIVKTSVYAQYPPCTGEYYHRYGGHSCDDGCMAEWRPKKIGEITVFADGSITDGRVMWESVCPLYPPYHRETYPSDVQQRVQQGLVDRIKLLGEREFCECGGRDCRGAEFRICPELLASPQTWWGDEWQQDSGKILLKLVHRELAILEGPEQAHVRKTDALDRYATLGVAPTVCDPPIPHAIMAHPRENHPRPWSRSYWHDVFMDGRSDELFLSSRSGKT